MEMDATPLPYEIQHSPELGRYLVASRDLSPLEIIIQERPLACSPADDSANESLGDIPMCLGCCARMSGNPKSTCSKCNWPVCSLECEQISHHAENECPIFAKNQVQYGDLPGASLINETIFILRLCLLKSQRPSVWTDVLMKFEHHTQIRRTKKLCLEKDRKVLANLKVIFPHHQIVDSVDDDEADGSDENENGSNKAPFGLDDVIKISGIINVNAFSSTKLEDECSTRRVRRRVTISQCVFPTASLLAHSCIPNASWTVSTSPNFEMTIRTTVKIPKGETIAIAYAPREIFLATLQRLVSTEEIAHFICHCQRCRDPTEEKTFIGAIRCPRCMQCSFLEDDLLEESSNSNKSYLLPKTPVNPESEWECRRCENIMDVQQVVKRLVKIEKEFERIKSRSLPREEEADELEYLYKRALNEHLHKNHYLLQDISLRIVNRQASCIFNLDGEEIARFLFHCRALLKVADVLCPGYCRHRALIQFYLSQVMMIEARKKSKEGLDREAFLSIYRPIYQVQKEAFTYFRSEDETENRHRPRSLRFCSQFVACLMEDMKESLKYI